MLSSFMKNGALAARTKCMYGKRLLPEQYEVLASKRAISDFIQYLKAETGYSEAFAGVHENRMHYGQIETLIKRDIYQEFLRLCTHTSGHDRRLMDFILMRTEMMELLSFIPLLLSGRQSEYICTLPELTRSRTKMDFASFSACTDFADLVRKLRGTRYYPILLEFTSQKQIDFTRLEVALTQDFYGQMKKTAEKTPDMRTRRAMMRRIAVHADLINISRIVRLKVYYAYGQEETMETLIHPGKRGGSRLIQALAGADAGEIDDLLKNSKYGALVSNLSVRDPDRLYHQLVYRESLRILYGPEPSVDMVLAYMDLKEIEMRNIIIIVNGIVHAYSPQEIKGFLVM